MGPADFHIDKPYPKVENLEPNTRYATILLNSYSSSTSELTAILQYTYHHMVLSESHPDVANTLHGISIVEMHHLQMLGDCIFQLGLDPKFGYFRQNMLTCWNSGFISYGASLQERLYADIQGEKSTVQQYRKIAGMIREPQIQKLLNRIIEDEELHFKILSNLARKYL